MAQKNDVKDPEQLEKIETTLSKAELYIENNQKRILYIVGIVVLVVAGFMAYNNFYLKSQETKAQGLVWQADNFFKVDSFHIALYGNENIVGYAEIVDDFGGTKVGNYAKYCAGVCAIHLGEFQNSIDYLEGFESTDPLLAPLATSIIGDAYNELGNHEKAIELYLKAATDSEHEVTSPKFLMKAGLTYEKLGKKDKALEIYNSIKQQYEDTQEGAVIDKYIARVSL